MHAFAGTHIHVCTCVWRQEDNLGCYVLYFSRQGFSFAWSLLIRLGCLASKPQHPAYLHYLTAGCKHVPPCRCSFFHGVWGLNSGPYASKASNLPTEAISLSLSPAHRFYYSGASEDQKTIPLQILRRDYIILVLRITLK